MKKRDRLEVIYDILNAIKNNRNSIRITPLIRKSNLSSKRFLKYYEELLETKLVQKIDSKNIKYTSLTEKGLAFIEKYKTIKTFVEDFGL